MRSLRNRVLVFVVAALFAVAVTPTNMAACGWWAESIYYSDYFQTITGYGITDCDGSYETWGTLDGEYYLHAHGGCCTPTGHQRCFQKINGAFVQIPCP